MIESIKKDLYFNRKQLLIKKGLEDGSIKPFDDEFYEKLSHTYISCLPVSIHIKYLIPFTSSGKCYDRSLYMFFCFPHAVLVHGNHKDLELQYGKEDAVHWWIEIDDYCYDPSTLQKYKKGIYYELYNPYNIYKITIEEYKNYGDANKKFYENVVNTKLSDFQPNGKKRTYLFYKITPIIQKMAEMSTDVNFKKELDDYLKSIQYDEKQIYEETDETFKSCL